MSFLKKLFGGGAKKEAPPPVPVPEPPPTIEDAEVKARDEADAMRKRRGSAANILTSKAGAATPKSGAKELLGG